LIVRQTLDRLSSVKNLIHTVAQNDFPFDDSRDALHAIEDLIDGQIEQLEDQITESSDLAATRTFCERANDDINTSLPVLGLLQRSADPIGAQELQWPLKELTKLALEDQQAKLVITSDWNYSPFTLIPTPVAQRKIVLVGMPVSEANNALVAPLAGHELGHNIWLSRSYGVNLSPDVSACVDSLKNWTRKDRLEGRYSMAFECAFYQVEEIFCDVIGLLLFRESYLHAFRYLLSADRESMRSGNYPSISNRTRILCESAKKSAIDIPPDFSKSFHNGTTLHSFLPLNQVHDIADKAAGQTAGKVYNLAKEIVDNANLCKSTPAGIRKVLEYFRRRVPARGVQCFQDIINAAWQFELENGNELIPDAKSREVSLVSELAFKTCEVFQIESLSRAS
jgi:hypothetical protein